MLSDRTIFQNAWVVPDLTRAMARWTALYGVGPFYVLDHLDLSGSLYHGRPSGLVLSVGLAQAGPLQIELIEQHNDGPSLYREQPCEGRSVLHHVCIYSRDFEADRNWFEAAGCPMALEGSSPDGGIRFAYYDTRDDLSVFTEVITPHRFILARNELVWRAALDWDGADPVRILQPDGSYRRP